MICCFFLYEGGVTNILTTELFTQTSRPAAYMIAGSVNWFSFFFIGMVFPFIVVGLQTIHMIFIYQKPFKDCVSEGVCVSFPQLGLQQYCFLVFLAICSLVATYIYLVVPETKNKTFLEIQNDFQSSKNKKVCNGDGAGANLLTTSVWKMCLTVFMWQRWVTDEELWPNQHTSV